MPAGRPSAYQPEFADQARKLCLLGATDDEIADFLGVNVRSVYRWKKSQPEFCQALKDGKVVADTDVASRLNERARGFEYDEAVPIKVKTVLYDGGKRVSEIERVEVVMVHRVVPPDTTACIFWLKNRRSQDWRDRQNLDVTSNGEGITDIAAASYARLQTMRAEQPHIEAPASSVH